MNANLHSHCNQKLLACDYNSDDSNILIDNAKNDVERISSNVQAQIEQLFADVAKDSTSRFSITCLGSLPLKSKIASLKDLQEPLRELYLHNEIHKNQKSAFLDICENSLILTFNGAYNTIEATDNDFNKQITHFHNIAVWSAVKFCYSRKNADGAFLPLISTETINKTDIFHPLSTIEQQLWRDKEHSPIFAIVMRSMQQPKVLECHAFLCNSTEDAIIIAATLYQSLMFYVSSSHPPKTKRHIPRNENGINCMSISGSSIITGIRPKFETPLVSATLTNSSDNRKPETTMRKSCSITLINSKHKCIINNTQSLSGDNPKIKPFRKHHSFNDLTIDTNTVNAFTKKRVTSYQNNKGSNLLTQHSCHRNRTRNRNSNSHTESRNSSICSSHKYQLTSSKEQACLSATQNGGICDNSGDILTRVAIPRSGSFLNTGGLSRYKSLATRRYGNKCDIGSGGGGSPLGFNELFNEFRTHENLHSLDEILSAIIDANGMSFNDLKPIYKEFLLKLSVTLTKDELFQRSKHIMRRQRKKNSKSKNKNFNNSSNSTSTNTNTNTNTISKLIGSSPQQMKTKTSIFGKKSLKKVFQFSKLRTLQRIHSKFNDHKPSVHQSLKPEPEPAISCHLQRHLGNNSGSDISLIRHDNALSILNRNSSSGYVSCSECNVDSEGCSCKYAYRCYCSLRKYQDNYQQRRKNNRMSSKQSNTKQVFNSNTAVANGTHPSIISSIISCNSDDKCYCSLPKNQDNHNRSKHPNDNDNDNDTTFCDTESCKTSNKCYCKNAETDNSPNLKVGSNIAQLDENNIITSTSQKTINYDQIALEYELFNVTTNNRPVQPDEALSVKKSMEAAALFGDFKLSQTTDIKGIKAANNLPTNIQPLNCDIMCSLSIPKLKNCSNGKRRDEEAKSNSSLHSLSTNSLRESCYVAALIDKYPKGPASTTHVISAYNDKHYIQHIVLKDDPQSDYQSMRTIQTSLEDTLGYLP